MVCSGLPMQPLPIGVLGRTQGDWRHLWHPKAKHAFCVATDLGGIAPAPSGVNVVNVFKLPILQMAFRVQRINSCFFLHFASGCCLPAFFKMVFAARDRLPRAGVGSANQQDLAAGGVNHHQHRLRNFVDRRGHSFILGSPVLASIASCRLYPIQLCLCCCRFTN